MAKPRHTSWRDWWWVVLLEWLWQLLRELLKPQPPPPFPPSPPPDNNGRTDMSLEFIQNNAEAYYTASSGTAGDQTFTDQLGNHAALQRGSTTSVDSNDPRYVIESEDFVFHPAVSGNYMSVPDAAALDITGDIDVRVKVALPDYTPSGTQDLLSKWNTTGNQRSWLFQITTSGNLQLVLSTDGTATATRTSTAAVSTTDRDTVWLRASVDVDNGASQHVVRFYTSTDGSSWAQLGSDVTNSGTTSIHSGTAVVSTGSHSAGTSSTRMLGNLFRAQVYDGIDGTKVLDIDVPTDNTTASQTSFTATTGQTVTLNRSTTGNKLIYVPADVGVWQSDGTDDYLQLPATLTPTWNGATGAETVMLCYRRFGASGGGSIRLYSTETATIQGAFMWLHTGTIPRASAGFTGFVSDESAAGGDGTVVVQGYRVDQTTIESYFSPDSGFTGSPTNISGVGTIPHTAPRICSRGHAVVTAEMAKIDVFSIVVFTSAISDDDADSVANYLLAKAEATLFQPATIAATTTLPSPTVTQIILAQPAAIAATATLPAPTIVMPPASPATLTIRDTGHTATAREQT